MAVTKKEQKKESYKRIVKKTIKEQQKVGIYKKKS
jgi:hypothetical protein